MKNVKEKIKDDTNIKMKLDEMKNSNIKASDSFKIKLKKSIQRAGSFMAGMIMPVVSILIAWGLLAAAFLGSYKVDASGNTEWVKKGWFNSEAVGQLIEPCIKYLIPILIGYTAGNMVYKVRGGMMGAFITMSIIIGSEYIYSNMAADWVLGDKTAKEVGSPNQIVGAMIVAPLTVYVYKKIELTYINKIKPGFEMLVRNFSLALWAIVFGLATFFSWGFVMYGISYVMVAIIELFTKFKWLFPFMSILTEPLRAVFLNNALNHGVMSPLGLTEVAEKDYSAFFMVGGNPGPGFGLLLAYVAWRKQQRGAAAGSSAIQLIGGIHEVHYVYILAEPIMILSTIGGAFVSLTIVALFGGGAIAPISPGSLISVISMSGSAMRILINVAAVFAGALTSFGIASFIMIFNRKKSANLQAVTVTDEGITFEENKKEVIQPQVAFNFKNAKIIKVACDAGVGSSAMAAGILKKWVKQNEIDVDVSNCAVKDLTPDVDIVVTMHNFKEVASENSPNAYIYTVKQYLGKDVFTELQQKLIAAKKGE
ncbi:PTS system, mannitol-specific IIBC component [Spiroplasma helicoides]|uniref:PTS system mannitol-specific EIICB component n=1 Tax=Spiroplasma helicoides TaxID=216938 RepID=A0A1B3SL72_9MOLU|nr:PTS transporter subunit EIIC [Spiroplasma helicoides]AOG60679.1 PTS system, mannitol-specific IIBC component [Spiroplasma helicoides]